MNRDQLIDPRKIERADISRALAIANKRGIIVDYLLHESGLGLAIRGGLIAGGLESEPFKILGRFLSFSGRVIDIETGQDYDSRRAA